MVCKICYCSEFPDVLEMSRRGKKTNSKVNAKCYALHTNAVTDTSEVSKNFFFFMKTQVVQSQYPNNISCSSSGCCCFIFSDSCWFLVTCNQILT